jgi:MinD-like ATPase involved in chromosome partitioning or flagellar assembly
VTGQYEEPEQRDGHAAQAEGALAETTDNAAPAGSNGGSHEPETSPGRPNPIAAHPEPQYVDPSQPETSGSYPVGETPQPYYPNPAQSGPHPWPAGYPQAPDARGWQGVPAPAAQSGPHPVQPYPQPPQPQAQPQQPQPQQPQPQQPFPPHAQGAPAEQPPQNFGQDLSSAQLLRQAKRAPQSGWRKAVYLASGKTVNPGEGPADRKRRELIARVNQPLQGCYKIAMLSLKGGVGKTTATATLGATFASLRGDRVIAVDANPDRGTLSQKIPLETTATVRHLLRDAHRISRYSDVRSYTSQGSSRLEILASEQDPAVSEAFSEQDYRRSVTLLEHFYNVVLTDCGTGLMHSAMKGVLDVADSLVIVSSSSIDGARSASATLDWLDAHGYGQLVARSVAVINSVRPASGKVDVDKLSAHFASRCRAVSRIPFDPHLEEGAEVELEQLAAPTRMALLELAAVVADDFPQAPGRNPN